MGKTLTPSREASEGAFTALNTDEETVDPDPRQEGAGGERTAERELRARGVRRWIHGAPHHRSQGVPQDQAPGDRDRRVTERPLGAVESRLASGVTAASRTTGGRAASPAHRSSAMRRSMNRRCGSARASSRARRYETRASSFIPIRRRRSRSRRVGVHVVAQLSAVEEGVDQLESRGWAVPHGHGRSPVELDHGRGIDLRAVRRRARRSAASRWRPRSRPRRARPAIAACSVYGPKRCDASARSTSATPSAICARFQRERSWSSSSTTSPVGRRARGAARFVQQHEREQSDRLGLRQQLHQQPAEADRLGREIVRGSATRPDDGRVALVEHQVDDVEHRSRDAPRSSARAGTW